MPHADALTTPFCLSVLTVTRGNVSKRLIADAHGKPIKDPSHSLAISTGILELPSWLASLALASCYSG